ncbi:MAG: hypothetical protein D6160_14030 [Ketobacter sp.]|nr:MAG: hypothetical protein D6160_14030 [Ketobacter sp.]
MKTAINEVNKQREAYTANTVGHKGTVALKHWHRSERQFRSGEVCNAIEAHIDQPLLQGCEETAELSSHGMQ